MKKVVRRDNEMRYESIDFIGLHAEILVTIDQTPSWFRAVVVECRDLDTGWDGDGLTSIEAFDNAMRERLADINAERVGYNRA